MDFILKGPIPSDGAIIQYRNQRVITLRINSACETIELPCR